LHRKRSSSLQPTLPHFCFLCSQPKSAPHTRCQSGCFEVVLDMDEDAAKGGIMRGCRSSGKGQKARLRPLRFARFEFESSEVRRV